MASSRWLGSRPSSATIASASSSVRPSARWIAVSMAFHRTGGDNMRRDAVDAGRQESMPGREVTRWSAVRHDSLPRSRSIALETMRDTTDMPARAKRGKTPMSAAHKEALAIGREEGRAVRGYLEALEAHRPKRGRKRSPESIQKRLDQIEDKLESADPLSRVHLVQERMNLQNELAAKDAAVDLVAMEEGFIRAGRSYGERKGISYAAWREAGVDAS